MTKHSSVIKSLLRGRRAESGEAVLTFAILLPVLLALSLGILEFSLVMLDYNRASEATRRAARIAAMQTPIGNLSGVETGDVVCMSAGGNTSCSGGAVEAPATFDSIVSVMQAALPTIQPENVQVVYKNSGIGSIESGGLKPLVSVNLVNFQRPFMFVHLFTPAPPQLTYPDFSTTQMVAGYIPP